MRMGPWDILFRIVLVFFVSAEGQLCSGCFGALLSHATKRDIKAALESSSHLITLAIDPYQYTANPLPRPCVYFDFLNSILLSRHMRSAISDFATIVNANEYEVDPAQKRLFRTPEQLATDFAGLIGALGIARLCVLVPPSLSVDTVRSALKADLTVITISQELSISSVRLLLRKEVVAKGLSSLLILVDKSTTLKLLQAMRDCHMDRTALNIVMTQEAAGYRDLESVPEFALSNVLFLGDEECFGATSEAELAMCKVEHWCEASDVSAVITLQSGRPVSVGSILHGNVTICRSCFSFHTGDSQLKHISELYISFNNGTMNPSGDTNGGEAAFYLGATLAVEKVNEDGELLPNSRLVLNNLTAGMNQFNSSWVAHQLAAVTRDSLGLAFIHGHYSSVAVPLYQFLEGEKGFDIPQIGENAAPLLSSTTAFPRYTRIVMSAAYISVLYTNVLKRYGWKRTALLYCDDLYCTTLYERLSASLLQSQITITNPESLRKLPSSMSSYPSDYLSAYQSIADSDVRVILLIMYGSTLFYTLEALYDLGIRRGDLVFLALTWLVPTLFTVGSEESLAKRRELLHGAIQFDYAAFYGPKGREVESAFIERFQQAPAHFACNFYDIVLMLAHALDFLIETGGVYENPAVLCRAIRKTRFVGCTGDVSIEDGTNDRSPMVFQILNSLVSRNGSVTIQEIGTYNPSGLLLFNFTRAITWPDGTSLVPSDRRFSEFGCPFAERDVRLYAYGVALEVGVIWTISACALLLTVLIWVKRWPEGEKRRVKRSRISFDDYIHFATIAIEALQYFALGPHIPNRSQQLATISRVSGWDVKSIVKLSQGHFTVVFNLASTAVCMWLVFLSAIVLKRCRWLCEKVSAVGHRALPLLGNLCFLPIISCMLSVFQCGQAVSRGGRVTLADTFLLSDCYQHCWRPPHTAYAAIALLALSLYVPLAVYCRPIWQYTQVSLHVRTSPSYLMLKTMYQILLIAMEKTMREYYPEVHIAAFFGLTAGFMLLSWKWKPYNYSRSNLWHFISHSVVLWVTLLVGIDRIASSAGTLWWLVVTCSGIGVICAAGAAYQRWRLPSMLYRPEGRSIVNLFRFQFSQLATIDARSDGPTGQREDVVSPEVVVIAIAAEE